MKRSLIAALVAAGLAAPASADMKWGWAGPLTGGVAALGEQTRSGALLAVEDINAKGGLLGQAISIQFEDDAGDPKQAVSVANRLVADGVQFVIGHQNSGASIAASDVYAEAGVLMISATSTNPALTERGLWNVFRTCGRDDQQGLVAAKYLLENFSGKKIFIIHDKTQYGLGLAEEVKKGINEGGLVEAGFEGITVGEKDYGAIVSRIKDAGADAVYFGGEYTEGGLILRQLRDASLTIPLLGGDGLFSPELAAIAGNKSEDAVFVTFGPDPKTNPAAAAVLKSFAAKHVDPEGNTLYAYAAVQVVAQAITAAGTADATEVAGKIHSGMVFQTVIGPLSFDEKGDLKRLDFVMYRLRQGKFEQITR